MPSSTRTFEQRQRSITSRIGVGVRERDPDKTANAYRDLHFLHVDRAVHHALYAEHALTTAQRKTLVRDVVLAVAVAAQYPDGCECENDSDRCDSCVYGSELGYALDTASLTTARLVSAVENGTDWFAGGEGR